jgi:hypothetical protein
MSPRRGLLQYVTLFAALAASGSTSGSASTISTSSCDESDANLVELQSRLCKSLACSDNCPCLNDTKADGDWPSQVTYMNDILTTLTADTTCLNTTTADSFMAWFEVTSTDDSFWWYSK